MFDGNTPDSARRRIPLPSPAMAVALAALFVAIGGTAIAAKHYLISSTSQISPKVLRALRGRSGPSGARGIQGPQGPAGAAGANLTAQTPLPSGQSESGTFAAGGGGDAGVELEKGVKTYGAIGTGLTFTQPLASYIDPTHIIGVRNLAAAPPECPGLGRAAPGFLCLYETGHVDVKPVDPFSSAKYQSLPQPGVYLGWFVTGEGEPFVGGEYTVTAP